MGFSTWQFGASPAHWDFSSSGDSHICKYGLWVYISHIGALTFLLVITNWCEGKGMIWVVSIRCFLWSIWPLKWRHRKMEGLWNWESLMAKLESDCPWIAPSVTLLEVWGFIKSFDSISYDSVLPTDPLFTSVTRVSNCYLKTSKQQKT